MTKKWIIIVAWAIVAVAWLAISLCYIRGLIQFAQWEAEYSEVYIEVPDSDLTVVAEYRRWLGSMLGFYYVDENGKRIYWRQGDCNAGYNPFEAGDYEVINNQNGTFTIRWSNRKNPVDSKDYWDEVTYAFPS